MNPSWRERKQAGWLGSALTGVVLGYLLAYLLIRCCPALAFRLSYPLIWWAL